MSNDDPQQAQPTAQQQQETAQTREVEDWARPSYDAAWRAYLAAGAPYGRSHDGWFTWVLEQVAAQRAAYEAAQAAAQRGPSLVARMVASVAHLLRRQHRHAPQQQ